MNSNQNHLDSVDLSNIALEREATGFWLDIRKDVLDLMISKSINPAEAIPCCRARLSYRFALAKDLKTECKIAEKDIGLQILRGSGQHGGGLFLIFDAQL